MLLNKILTLFAFFFLCISFCSWEQDNSKLDSLIEQYITEKENRLKVDLAFKITSIELYHNPSEAKKKNARNGCSFQKIITQGLLDRILWCSISQHYRH